MLFRVLFIKNGSFRRHKPDFTNLVNAAKNKNITAESESEIIAKFCGSKIMKNLDPNDKKRKQYIKS